MSAIVILTAREGLDLEGKVQCVQRYLLGKARKLIPIRKAMSYEFIASYELLGTKFTN